MSTYGQPDFSKRAPEGAAFGQPPGFGQVQPGGVFVFGRPGRLDSEESLRSYLLVRAIGRSVRNTVLWAGLLVLALAVVVWLLGVKVLGILIGLVAVAVLVIRAAVTSLGSPVRRELGRSADRPLGRSDRPRPAHRTAAGRPARSALGAAADRAPADAAPAPQCRPCKR